MKTERNLIVAISLEILDGKQSKFNQCPPNLYLNSVRRQMLRRMIPTIGDLKINVVK